MAIDELDKLNTEEEVWSSCFVGEGVAQIICGKCITNGRWLVEQVAMLEGKRFN